MSLTSREKLELNKILSACATFACLERTGEYLRALEPSGDLKEVRTRLEITAECDKLLYTYGVGKVESFPDVNDPVARASKGACLSCAELTDVKALLRSARIAHQSISGIEEAEHMRGFAAKLYYDINLERDIDEKILSDGRLSDDASDALYTIRSKIKSLNERIRSTLSEYVSGKDGEYLQDSIVTIRNDRYVIPVKAEHKSRVKGFVHDRSQSGATFFIEPEYVLNLNNELIALQIDEREEVERILKALSARVGAMRDRLETDAEALSVIDSYYARAEYSYSIKAVCPQVNKRGYVNIIKGRHPLIDKDKVVPVSVELGKNYSFLLLSGANTGGKTVTLKMVGLFCLMAECGLFIPAAAGSEVCAFENVFCDLGDSQSIEDSLSTFSSHITNIISICNGVTEDSLVLIDELGGGTNPDEGQALASAVTEHLVNSGCKGIITTHFTALKEFACTLSGIENAAMQFDSATLKPLYTIKIGMPGASNALAISRRMGMPPAILQRAEQYLSDEGRTYDNIIRRAEESRLAAQETLERAKLLEEQWGKKSEEVKKTLESLERERRNLFSGAKAESRRIINERTARAEELLSELEQIFEKEEISQTDLIRARTLKNKIKDEGFEKEGESSPLEYLPVNPQSLKVGQEVFVDTMQSKGTVQSLNLSKGEAEVMCGSIRLRVKLADLKLIPTPVKRAKKYPAREEGRVRVVKKFGPSNPSLEINVIGMTVEEALYEVENFLDKAITDNLEVVKIIHGMGTGKLRSAIAQRLKRHRGVKEFRSGRYGEGETGVTIVTLK